MKLDLFFEMPCLTEKSSLLNGIVIQKKWLKSADKRYIGQYLQKFINYNSKMFDFIGVKPYLQGFDQNTSIAFRSSEFVGAIPLKSSDSGKQIGDFVVYPRFVGREKYSDYIEILNILGAEINPTIIDSLPLISGRNFRPPFYLEATKFIRNLEELVKSTWRKFDNIEKCNSSPLGQVNWKKYINLSYKIENLLKFPIKSNVLSEFHSEFSEIKYVFNICKNELQSENTPIRFKILFKDKISFLEEKLYLHLPKQTNYIKIHFSDSQVVKNCKTQANKILQNNFSESTAWKVDYSEVYERFVQYIFKETAKETWGKVYPNYRFYSKNHSKISWELKHLEPDAVYKKNDTLILIDAKYKSNLYNKFEKSDILKEEHRHDLHQLLAYSSFNNSNNKFSFLCYPSEQVEMHDLTYINPINNLKNTVVVFGIPLNTSSIKNVKIMLGDKLNRISN